MKGLLFTDIHWGRRNNSLEHNQDCADFIDWVCKEAVTSSVDFIGFLGDWFESRNAIDVSTMNMAYHAAVQLSKLNIPIYFCVGNHDLYKRFTRDKFSTVHYSDIPNFYVVDEPIVYDNMLWVPFLFEEEYPSLVKYRSIPIWLGHFEFAGFAITSYNTIKEDGPSHKQFDKQMILSGHYHKRQSIDNVHYIGNVFPCDFGDAGDNERGIAFIDTDTKDVSFKTWNNAPSYHRVNYSNIKNLSFTEKSRVKCILDVDVEYDESSKTKEEIVKKFGLREFSFEEVKVSISDVTDVEIEDDSEDIKSIKHLLFKMIDAMDVENMDKPLLKDILEKSGEFDDSISNNTDPITFNKIKIRNFMSYGNNETEVLLNSVGFNSIVGKNLDFVLHETPDQNGTGKSSILNAICYVLFDKVIDPSISSDDLINNFNKTNMVCELSLSIGSVDYTITRRRKAGKSGKTNDVKIVKCKDGQEEDITKDSATNTNKLIKSIVGLEYETFVRIVVFSATNTPFLSLPITSASQISQTDILEDLFKQKELTLKAENIKKYQKQINDLLTVEQRVVERESITFNEHKRKLEQVQQQEQNWDLQREKDIEEIENLLASIPYDIDEQIESYNKVEALKNEQRDIQSKIRMAEMKIKNISQNVSQNEQIIKSLEASICPFCQQSHIDNEKLHNHKQDNVAFEEERCVLEDELVSLVDSYDALIEEINTLKVGISSDIPHLMELRNKRTTYEVRMQEMNKAINPYSLTYEMMIDTVINEPSYDKVNEYIKIVEHCQFLVKILTKKDSHVRKALLKRNLPFLNKKVNEYVAQLGLPHKIEITDELTTIIKLRGRQFNFATLSAGQKARINIAFCVAFRDVLIRMHSPINIYMLDECLDHGLSHQGAVAAAKLLRTKAKLEKLNLIVITHREEIAAMNFDKVITVVLENGFSRIE